MYRAEGGWIRDQEGRRIIFRGVNLSGGSKLPSGYRGSREELYAWRDSSFIGRPFPLAEARDRFRDLAAWGLRFVRLLCPWEAVEHAGPGRYDRAFLEYFRAIVEEAARAGIDVYVNPHQDAFSRWTGGDGAPAWTLEAVGFDLPSLHASGAALLREEMADPPKAMVWPTNYNRLGCATMFTLFLGGNDFAPGVRIQGEPVQEFLQGSFIRAMAETARALKGLPNVVGFGPLNEPSLGFIGLADASRLQRAMMRRGLMPSPFQAMAAGEGFPVSVERWAIDLLGNHRAGRGLLNPSGERAWAEGAECVWRRAGVWDIKGGKPVLLDPGRFALRGGALSRDHAANRNAAADAYLKPFLVRFIEAIRAELPGSLAFVEGVPNGEHATWAASDPPNVVNAAHWYDGFTLITKRYQEFLSFDTRIMAPAFGPRGIRKSFQRQIAYWKGVSEEAMGGAPTLIGEFGLPFDLKGRRADRDASFRVHERAFSAYYGALDANLASAAIWNYTSDNDPLRGDGWNGEDFSIHCQAQGGPRALAGWSRPYAARTAGTPVEMRFDRRSGVFGFEYEIDPGASAPTEVFLPERSYPGSPLVRFIRGEASVDWDPERRILSLRARGEGRLKLEIGPGKA